MKMPTRIAHRISSWHGNRIDFADGLAGQRAVALIPRMMMLAAVRRQQLSIVLVLFQEVQYSLPLDGKTNVVGYRWVDDAIGDSN